MFEKIYEFRYSDLNRYSNIKESTVLDLFQDISGLHVTQVGLPPEKLAEMSMVFLLEGWHVRFDEPLSRNSNVTVTTGIMEMTSLRSTRKYEIFQNGKCAVTGTAVWYAINTDKMRIMRVPDELFGMFDCIDEEDNGLPYISLRPSTEHTLVGEKKIENRDLDTNHHLNNVKSVEIALDFLPDDFKITELCVKYRKEILKGETIKIYSHSSEEGTFLEIVNENGDVCVIVGVK